MTKKAGFRCHWLAWIALEVAVDDRHAIIESLGDNYQV